MYFILIKIKYFDFNCTNILVLFKSSFFFDSPYYQCIVKSITIYTARLKILALFEKRNFSNGLRERNMLFGFVLNIND